jgi:hypothetical protein
MLAWATMRNPKVFQIENYLRMGLNRKQQNHHMQINAYFNQKRKVQPHHQPPQFCIVHLASGEFISHPYPNVAQPVSRVIRQGTAC